MIMAGPTQRQLDRLGHASRDLRGGQGRLEVGFLRGLPAENRLKVWTGFCAFLVLRGEGAYALRDGRSWPLAPGSLGLHIPGVPHDVRRTDPAGTIEWALHCDAATAGHLAGLGLLLRDPPVARPGLGAGVLGRIEALAALLTDPGAGEARCLLAFAECLHVLTDHGPPPDPMAALVERARRELAGDHACRLELPRLAREHGLSYIHFRRCFRRLAGCSPDAWRQRHRLQAARTLLRERGLGVARTAQLLGYANPFSFSRQYRRAWGRPPSAER
jgi:AraC-like DNA-binding protein